MFIVLASQRMKDQEPVLRLMFLISLILSSKVLITPSIVPWKLSFIFSKFCTTNSSVFRELRLLPLVFDRTSLKATNSGFKLIWLKFSVNYFSLCTETRYSCKCLRWVIRLVTNSLIACLVIVICSCSYLLYSSPSFLNWDGITFAQRLTMARV